MNQNLTSASADTVDYRLQPFFDRMFRYHQGNDTANKYQLFVYLVGKPNPVVMTHVLKRRPEIMAALHEEQNKNGTR